MKQAVEATMAAGAKGIKIRCAGRLGGVEMHRSEVVVRGSVPLTKLTANIDYGQAMARCTYGILGVKVWIYLGVYPPQVKEKEAPRGADA
jgi:small subunit ribosomal protein S3